MRLTFKAPFSHDRHIELAAPHGLTLGQMCGQHVGSFTACQVNGVFDDGWQSYMPGEQDRIIFYAMPGIAGYPILTMLIIQVALTAISIGLSYVIRALTNTPANQAGKPEQVFGIAGVTNTTALGTPKWLVYGTCRVAGHIIDTRVDVSDDGKSTNFGILYFMGEGPIAGMSALQINDTPLDNFPTVIPYIRLGDGNSTPIPSFDTTSAVWADGRALPVGTPIVYTTHGQTIERVTLIFVTQFLFEQDASDNSRLQAHHTLHIEYKAFNDANYLNADGGNPLIWVDRSEAQRFRAFKLEFDHADQWLIRITLTSTTNTQATVPSLYNVQEEATATSAYPTSSLLAFTGIASSQISSFESMRGSALVQGLILTTWDGANHAQAWSDNRAWVLRHFLTNARIGLGHRIDASLFDDDAALDAAMYWDEDISGTKRDQCNIIINDRRQAPDWLRVLLTEGRAIMVQAAFPFSLRVDKAQSPGLLYAGPGNIIEGSVRTTAGDGQGERQNTIRGQYRNRDNDDILDIFEVVAGDIGNEPVRESLVSVATLTDRAQVFWLLRYQLLRARMIRRHYTWQSPHTAMVSEPLDHVWLSHDTANFTRGVSGFCPAGSAVNRLVLDHLITLAPSTTYQLLVRHQATNAQEQKVVATGAGDWGALAPTVNFATAPAEGDIWALGVQTTGIVHVVMESVEQGEDGIYTLSASEYHSEPYDTPAPPAAIVRPRTNPSRNKPLPLWSVWVAEVPRIAEDGSLRTTLQFTVTPSLRVHSGQARSGGGVTTLHLAADEPTPGFGAFAESDMDRYYEGVTVELLAGAGSVPGETRVAAVYAGATQIITVDTAWAVAPDATTTYQLTWPDAEDTVGFLVEVQHYPTEADFSEYATFNGFQGESTPEVNFIGFFRFTPLSASGGRNLHGRWVMEVTVGGDVGAPGGADANSGDDGSGSGDTG